MSENNKPKTMAKSTVDTGKSKETSPLSDAELAAIRQRSHYNEQDKPAPDNSMFFEERSNPLSSKG